MNKFIEYVINNQLQNTLFSIENSASERNKMNSDNFEEYIYFDDFFKLMIENNLSVSNIKNIVNKTSKNELSDLLFGFHSLNDINKENKVTLFKPLLINDFDFFHSCFKKMLLCKPKEQFKDFNINIFKTLVNIGIEHNHFSKFNLKDFESNTDEYLNILIDNNIFNSSFNLDDLISRTKNHIKNTISYKEILPFANTYKNEIANILTSLKSNNQIEKTELDIIINNHIINNPNDLSILNNDYILEFLCNHGNYSLNSLLQNKGYTEFFINKINDDLTAKFFADFAYSNSSLLKFEKLPDNLNISTIEKIAKSIELYSLAPHKYRTITLFLFKSFKKLTEDEQLKLYNSNGLNIIQSVSNSLNSSVKGFSTSNFEKYLQTFKNEMKLLNPSLKNKIESKMLKHIEKNIYSFTFNFNSKFNSFNSDNFFENLISYIISYHNIDFLKILNADQNEPLWMKKQFFHPGSKSEQSIIQIIVSNTNEIVLPKLVKWLTQDDNIKHTLSLKIKNKDIINFILKSDFSNECKIKSISECLSNIDMFNYIKNSSSIKKSLSELNSNEINSKLDFYMLNQTILNTKGKSKTVKI